MDTESKLRNLTEQLVRQNPELSVVLEQVQDKPFEEQVAALVPVLTNISKNLDLASMMSENDLFYTNDQGTERLNPKYEAYLAERLQFDGDAPELRTGALPHNQKPAVPVETSSRNPVMIGKELEEASEKIFDQFRAIEGENTTVVMAHELPEPQDYQRGSLPVPQKVTGLTAQQFFALTPVEKKEYTWKFISTTQGRVSAVPVLADIVIDLLRKRGYEVAYGEGDKLVRESSWTLSLHNGMNSTQSNFSYLDIVSRSFLREFECGVKGTRLTISPINRVADRLFGWKMSVWD